MPSDNPDSGRDPDPDRGGEPDSGASPPPDPNPSDPTPSGGSTGPPSPSPPDGPDSPSDGADSPSDGPSSFADWIRDGKERAADNLPLALVPLAHSLLDVDSIERVLEFRGAHFGIGFRFPTALPNLWTFVSLPSRNAGVHVSPSILALPVLVLVQSVLVAGLLGSAHEILRTDEYDFVANARQYFVPVLLFVALVQGAGLVAFGVGATAPVLALVLFPLFILLSYLFYAAPYLLVVANLGVADALGQSYEWALAGGRYFTYGVGYLLFVAAVSVVGTALVVNLGALGILVGVVASAPVALVLTFATTGFVAELSETSEPSAPRRPE